MACAAVVTSLRCGAHQRLRELFIPALPLPRLRRRRSCFLPPTSLGEGCVRFLTACLPYIYCRLLFAPHAQYSLSANDSKREVGAIVTEIISFPFLSVSRERRRRLNAPPSERARYSDSRIMSSSRPLHLLPEAIQPHRGHAIVSGLPPRARESRETLDYRGRSREWVENDDAPRDVRLARFTFISGRRSFDARGERSPSSNPQSQLTTASHHQYSAVYIV